MNKIKKHTLNIVFILLGSIFSYCIGMYSFGGFIPFVKFAENPDILLTNMIWFCLVFALLYFAGAGFKIKNTLAFRLKNKEIRKYYRRRRGAAYIDMSLVLAICLYGEAVFYKTIYYEYGYALLIAYTLYTLCFALLNKGQTIGLMLFNLQGFSTFKETLRKDIFINILLGIVLPTCILFLLGWTSMGTFFLVLFLNFLCRIIWFEYRGGRAIEKWYNLVSISYKKKLLLSGIYVFTLFACGALYINSEKTNSSVYNRKAKSLLSSTDYVEYDCNSIDSKVLGLPYPIRHQPYPHPKKVQKYVDFLDTIKQSPKEYILSLFDQYDIVILQEARHGEASQWDFISDLVCDTAFAQKVGYVFSEYGSISQQEKLDTWMASTFDSDSSRQKSLACVGYLRHGSFFYFLENIYLFNQVHPQIKINARFTDPVLWNYWNYNRITEWMNSGLNRDDIMALPIINWYNGFDSTENNTRKKCLLITNGSHAYTYPKGKNYIKKHTHESLKQGRTGQYISSAFPGKVANVLQNTPSVCYFIPRLGYNPIQKGKWDLAFKLNNNKVLGFDLEGSPFGKDIFDKQNTQGKPSGVLYEDIFTGLITFNNYPDSLYFISYPYERYGRLQEIKLDSLYTEEDIENYKQRLHPLNYQYDSTISDLRGISRGNILPWFFYVIFSIIGLLKIIKLLLCFNKKKI